MKNRYNQYQHSRVSAPRDGSATSAINLSMSEVLPTDGWMYANCQQRALNHMLATYVPASTPHSRGLATAHLPAVTLS